MKIIEFLVKNEISFALAIQFTQFFKISIAYDTCIKTVGLQQPLPNNLVYLFRVVKTTLSSSYNISGLVPVYWLLFQCF